MGGTHIQNKRVDLEQRAYQEYQQTMADRNVANCLRAGRERVRRLHALKADIEVRLHALRLQVNRAAIAARAAAVAAAPGAAAHHVSTPVLSPSF